MKKCHACGEEKQDQDFHRDKTTKDGLNFYCKKCTNTRYRKARPLATGVRKPMSVLRRDKIRQDAVVKYGIDLVEVMESMGKEWLGEAPRKKSYG